MSRYRRRSRAATQLQLILGAIVVVVVLVGIAGLVAVDQATQTAAESLSEGVLAPGEGLPEEFVQKVRDLPRVDADEEILYFAEVYLNKLYGGTKEAGAFNAITDKHLIINQSSGGGKTFAIVYKWTDVVGMMATYDAGSGFGSSLAIEFRDEEWMELELPQDGGADREIVADIKTRWEAAKEAYAPRGLAARLRSR